MIMMGRVRSVPGRIAAVSMVGSFLAKGRRHAAKHDRTFEQRKDFSSDRAQTFPDYHYSTSNECMAYAQSATLLLTGAAAGLRGSVIALQPSLEFTYHKLRPRSFGVKSSG